MPWACVNGGGDGKGGKRKGAGLIRIGRIVGDIADRKTIDTYPAVTRAGIRLRPYVTVTGDLTVSARGVSDDASASVAE
ncbi:hypothetical protein [Streptomyces sp. KR80]|uniref:hypothetical protein n=1 Tax=Streptomyces sp. KR80 TaxID=3457426 RepID=UPI003FCF8768